MAQTTINNGDTGLAVRTAINNNFTELYSAVSFIRLDADYTLASQTASQALFNTTSAPNGRLTLTTGVYRVCGAIYFANMSATSGNCDFSLLGAGTATLAGQNGVIVGRDGSANIAGNGASTSGFNAQNNVGSDVVAVSVATNAFFTLEAMFKCTVAGTMIPSVALTTAAAAAAKAGSYLRIEKLAELGTNSKGAWS